MRVTRELVSVGGVERDVATQSRLEINMAVVAEYAASLRAGADLPPAVVFEDEDSRLWLADGWHRLHAHEEAELEEMWAEIRRGTRRDAILYAAGANHAHGLRRTNADKRRAVETLLRDPEWSAWSDRAIAEACRVSDKTVAAVRADLPELTADFRSGPQANADNRRVGRDGREIDVSGLRVRGDDAGGAAPEEPAGVMGGPEEPVALPLSAVQDDAREDRGVARATEGPSAALPSSASAERRSSWIPDGCEEDPAFLGMLVRDGWPADGRGDRHRNGCGCVRCSTARGVASESPPATPATGPEAEALLEDEDEEVVVRRPGSTSQAVTTSWRNSAPAVEEAPLIDLRCCSNLGIEWPEADLDVLDPPWSYVQRIGATRASNHYACLPISEIVHQTSRLRGARVAVWCTWPTEAAFRRWWPLRAVTGGVWVKSGALERHADAWDQLEVAAGDDFDAGHYGPGFHWAGCSEPVFLAVRRPAYTDRSVALRNAWIERPGEHSEKPVGWMVDWIRRWVPPGGLVCDPYAGLGTVARAVLLAGEGRRYLGTEIDPGRHAEALELLVHAEQQVHASGRAGVAVGPSFASGPDVPGRPRTEVADG